MEKHGDIDPAYTPDVEPLTEKVALAWERHRKAVAEAASRRQGRSSSQQTGDECAADRAAAAAGPELHRIR